jgi:hypothetical protein
MLIMNKIIIRVIIVSSIAGLFLLILFRSREPFGKSNSSFATEPQQEITKIEFSKEGEKLTLSKEGDNWLIDGKIEARKSGVLFILRVLQEIKIKSPVSAELFSSEITGKRIKPVKVRVYQRKKLLKSFLVFNTRVNAYGNIMKIKERSKPFIVYVPGYEGDIGSVFNLNKLYWQPYSVFNLLPSEIGSVEFENLSDTSSSFSIVNNNRQYTFSDRNRNLTGWNSSLVTRYLSYFTWIPFESWAFEIAGEEKKKIESREPLYRITVNKSGGGKIILTLWERIILENGNKINDSDRLLGKIQDSDEFFIMRYFDVDPLIKKRSYFFRQ